MKKISKIVCVILVIVIAVTSLAMPVGALSVNDFDDIEGHWAYKDIEDVVNRGLFRGTSKETFSPDTMLSRAMFVTILGRHYEYILEVIDGYEDVFIDTEKDSWYSKYVAWAAELKIVNGYGGKKFGPNDPITREQAAKILSNFASHLNFKTTGYDNNLLVGFKDSSTISGWALESMKWAVAEEIFRGTPNNTLEPNREITRAECAVITNKFINKYDVAIESNANRYKNAAQGPGQINTGWAFPRDMKYKYYNLTVTNHGKKELNIALISNSYGQDSLSPDVQVSHKRIKSGETYSHSDEFIYTDNPVETPYDLGFLSLTMVTPIDGSQVDADVRWLASTRPFK